MDLAIDLGLPYFTGDVLGVLRSKIKDENFLFVQDVCGHGNEGIRFSSPEKFWGSIDIIVRSFFGYDHIVYVAFTKSGRGDLDE